MAEPAAVDGKPPAIELPLVDGVNQIWIFAFGSLIWKPGIAQPPAPSRKNPTINGPARSPPPVPTLAGFEYSKKVEGYIKGYKRVFHQGSTDHRCGHVRLSVDTIPKFSPAHPRLTPWLRCRGTPSAPGRTVTLEEYPGSIVWGVAYQLAGNVEQQKETLKVQYVILT